MRRLWVFVLAMTAARGAAFGEDLGAAFAYQGRLESDGSAVNDTCDMAFSLWDASADGGQVSTLTFDGIDPNPPPVDVADGLFGVALDFGVDAFDDSARWLEIRVACPSGGAWTTLSPRQRINAVPNAVKAIGVDGHSLDSADGSVSDALFVDGAGDVGVGTTDPQYALDVAGDVRLDGSLRTGGDALDILVADSVRAMRFEFGQGAGKAPNFIAGSSGNTVAANVAGATIAGGGDEGAPNRVSADFGTVTGGSNNWAFGAQATVSGGTGNTAQGEWSTISGGQGNSAVGNWSAVGGGNTNSATGDRSFVGGGSANAASGARSVVVAGQANTASGDYGVVPGGRNNQAGGSDSFAAGRRAKANHDGAFVWGDSSAADFTSTAPDQFIVRANGGVGIGTAAPTQALEVVGTVAADAFAGDGSGLTGIVGSTVDIDNVALLRWDLLNRSFDAGGEFPEGVCFDGAHVWVTHETLDGTVTKFRASDGANLGTFPVGVFPVGVAFDGANVWVANRGDDTVTKLRAADGAHLGTFAVGQEPMWVAFDGADIWVTNRASGSVTRLQASDGAFVGEYSENIIFPRGLAFDGVNVWIIDAEFSALIKLRASDGAFLDQVFVGGQPQRVVFDGTNLWVTRKSDNTVAKIRASDGANVGTFPVGDEPLGLAFDGTNVWVANRGDDTVTKLRASDGADIGTFSVGNGPDSVAFDGANVWVTDHLDATVTRMSLAR